MGKDIRTWLFIAAAFLLGSINVLYNIAFYIFLVIAFLINLKYDFKGFCSNVKQERKFLILPVAGAVYIVLHYLCSLLIPNIHYKVSWGIIELLLLYFLFVPLYLLSAKNFVTPILLRRFLFTFCWGVILFCFAKLFCITGLSLFTEPMQALSAIYSGRFGGNMSLLGGFVYLEPQAVYICASAIISYFFILKNNERDGGKLLLINSIIIFILSLLFLSFTVTKGAVLAFGVAFMYLSFVYLRRKSLKFKVMSLGVLIVGLLCVYSLLPQAYIDRVKQMEQEIENIHDGKYQGGSIAPRLGLMKENFSHFNEFGIFGLGVYKNSAIREWYPKSPYHLGGIYNSHNTFVEYWLIGGIPGLLFILYYFFGSIIRMIKRKKYSFLAIAVILSLFVAANTCVIAILIDSVPVVVFLLAMFFLYLDNFVRIQRNDVSGSVQG